MAKKHNGTDFMLFSAPAASGYLVTNSLISVSDFRPSDRAVTTFSFDFRHTGIHD